MVNTGEPILGHPSDDAAGDDEPHDDEPHDLGIAARLNWLRAGVLGANDGIVSVAALVVGVAAATDASRPILIAGAAALAAGAISMALGEYVSVSSQRDSEQALIEKERWELENFPEEELQELVDLYAAKGLTRETAHRVAIELTEHDALAAHLETELRLNEDDISSPWHAAIASAIAFTVGAMLPLIAILVPPANWRIPTTFVAVIVALVVTGYISATLGESSRQKAITRVVAGGGLALVVTYSIGLLFGVSA